MDRSDTPVWHREYETILQLTFINTDASPAHYALYEDFFFGFDFLYITNSGRPSLVACINGLSICRHDMKISLIIILNG